MQGFTYLTPFIENPDGQKFAAGLILATVMIGLGSVAASRLKDEESLRESVVPPSRGSLSGIVDLMIEGFLKYFDSILGKERRRFAPFCASVFFFVLFANLLGLVPGVPPITTTVWINVGMALVVFAVFNTSGIREQGLVNYFKHFCGPMLAVAPIIFPLEILSTCLRILTLNMRLYWNITADHLVLETFTDLTKLVVPVAFYAMGTFVCFMQAFVFVTLTMIYILFAVQHEEEHH